MIGIMITLLVLAYFVNRCMPTRETAPSCKL
jgi:hypothetical protein